MNMCILINSHRRYSSHPPSLTSQETTTDTLNCYLVGGAVRDQLLGLPSSDRDWVVVGSTPERMQELGYKSVGKDFPVFLHPQTGEEYALAPVSYTHLTLPTICSV